MLALFLIGTLLFGIYGFLYERAESGSPADDLSSAASDSASDAGSSVGDHDEDDILRAEIRALSKEIKERQR